MTNYELLSLLMSAIAMIAAGIGVVISVKNLRISRDAIKIANGSAYTSRGELKMSIREKINAAKNEVRNAGMMLQEFKEKFPRKSPEKRMKHLYATLEDLFNSYESACNLYYSGNVNQDDFASEYKEEIADLVFNKEFKKYFDANTSSFKSMIRFANQN